MSTQVKQHLTEHEARTGIAKPVRVGKGPVPFDSFAWVRAALRHKYKLGGLHPTDERLLFTEEEFQQMLAEIAGHAPAQEVSHAKPPRAFWMPVTPLPEAKPPVTAQPERK